MKSYKVLVFRKDNRVTLLFMGNKDSTDIPCYQFSSKEIPITGEFTGFPKGHMIQWMKSIGFDFIGELSLKRNEYRNGNISKAYL